MFCSKCRRQAVIYQRYSGLHLCRTHFEADFEAKAKRAIRVHHWLSSGDRIGVVLSGVKESGALLYFLQRLVGRRHDVELLAVTIDEGIRDDNDTADARIIAGEMGVRHVTASFREVFGMTFDEIALGRCSRPSCSSCRILRTLCLERTARDHGITRLALGLNLDDEAESVFFSVITGAADRLIRPQDPTGDRVEYIKPFMYIPGREVDLYASFHGEAGKSGTCPYAQSGLQADIQVLLDTYDRNHPSARYALVNLGDRLRELGGTGKSHDRDDGLCPGRGDLVMDSCRSCRMPDEVGDA
jgi:tRNA(Ile)-lysidine synthase TilS/MesJ